MSKKNDNKDFDKEINNAADLASENTENGERLKLDDARRVKVLSPGMMVMKRFLRNKLAIAGLIILVFMFLFSFLGGAISPYKQTDVFWKTVMMSKPYANMKDVSEVPTITPAEGAEQLGGAQLAEVEYMITQQANNPELRYSEGTYSNGVIYRLDSFENSPLFKNIYRMDDYCVVTTEKVPGAESVVEFTAAEGSDFVTSPEFEAAYATAAPNPELSHEKSFMYFTFEDEEYLVYTKDKMTSIVRRAELIGFRGNHVYDPITSDETLAAVVNDFDFKLGFENAYGLGETGFTYVDEATGASYDFTLDTSPVYIFVGETEDIQWDLDDPESEFVDAYTEARLNGSETFTVEGVEYTINEVNYRIRTSKAYNTAVINDDYFSEGILAAVDQYSGEPVVWVDDRDPEFTDEELAALGYTKGDMFAVGAAMAYNLVERGIEVFLLGPSDYAEVVEDIATIDTADAEAIYGVIKETWTETHTYTVDYNEANRSFAITTPKDGTFGSIAEVLAYDITYVDENGEVAPYATVGTLEGCTVLMDGEEIAYVSTFRISPAAGKEDLALSHGFKMAAREACRFLDEAHVNTTTFAYESTEYSVERKNDGCEIKAPEPARVLRNNDSPSAKFLLGTDGNGMDNMTRMMYGGRISLMVGFVVIIIEMLIGVIFGGISGYFGGVVDTIMMRFVDLFNCIPYWPMMLITGSVLDARDVRGNIRIFVLVGIMGLLGWTGTARTVRGQILSLREQDFMVATEACGIRVSRRIFRHLVPNVMPLLIVSATMGLGSIIISEATLSFLGLGVQFPQASWGSILNSIKSAYDMTTYWYVWIPTGLCIVLAVLGFNFVGDGLRDAYDPKMKR